MTIYHGVDYELSDDPDNPPRFFDNALFKMRINKHNRTIGMVTTLTCGTLSLGPIIVFFDELSLWMIGAILLVTIVAGWWLRRWLHKLLEAWWLKAVAVGRIATDPHGKTAQAQAAHRQRRTGLPVTHRDGYVPPPDRPSKS